VRQIWLTRHGPPEVLELREAPDPKPGPGHVRVRIQAAGINFSDILMRMGLYPGSRRPPTTIGYEVAGTVDAVGPGLDPGWVGRAVGAVPRSGGYADVVCVPAAQVWERPAGMPAAEGAAFLVTYLTAYVMLVVMGAAKRGERVLVHNAGGGVGLAAVDICRILGVEVIGTASAAKHQFLRQQGVNHLIDYRTRDFEVEVRRLTAGQGVHIALDPVGGESWRKSYRSLAKTGRLIVFGASSLARGPTRFLLAPLVMLLRAPLGFHPLVLLRQNKAVMGVHLGLMWDEIQRHPEWSEQLLAWYREGRVRPRVDRTFPLAEAAAAHRYVQERKNLGKVVLVP